MAGNRGTLGVYAASMNTAGLADRLASVATPTLGLG
jgi:hypothetical protein